MNEIQIKDFTEKKVIDTFIFFNEFDILKFRLSYLNDLVDSFVICESNYTFSGKPKPYYLDKIIDDIPEEIRKKIIRLKYEPDISEFTFPESVTEYSYTNYHDKIEKGQRDYISNNLSNFSMDDYVMISDVDEIPNKEVIKKIINQNLEHLIYTIKCNFFYYNFKTFLHDNWLGSVFTNVKNFLYTGGEYLRANRHSFFLIENGGWHFSYFGDVENIKYKIDSFSHQEYNNNTYNNNLNIIESIKKRKYLFDSNYNFTDYNFNNFPEDIKEFIIDYFPNQYYMKIFIFGSNGMLGNYLTQYLSSSFEVIPITRGEIDLTKDFSLIEEKYQFNEYDVIINASGIIKQRDYCSDELIKVNSLFPHFLSTLGCNVIHITTDCVFSGKEGSYTEESYHDCIDDYGKSKSLGECEDLTIIRTSIIGEELENKKSLIEWVKSNKNTNVNGYINHFWNGITCLELCKHIQDIVVNESYWKGVRHYFSPETISKYQLVSYINEIYELNNKVIPIKNTYCDRSLDTKYYRSPVQISIKEQISELKKFNIIHKLHKLHKLHNFPQVNVVNLKENEERRKIFSSTFSKYFDLNIIFHQYDRISEKKCSEIIFNNENIPYYVTNKLSFLGAITSHLSTIKTWYETTNEEYGFFCEDDLSLETVDYWNFNWEEFIDMLPYEWQTVQLSLTRSPEIFFKHYKNDICFKHRSWDDWSCVAYIMKRSHAKKIIDNYYNETNFSLDYSGIDSNIRPKKYTDITPENIIYTSFEYNKNYIFPLFSPNYDFDSTVWDNLDEKNNPSEIIDWWKNIGKIKTLQELFDRE